MSADRTESTISTALHTAQQALLARRQQRRAERQALGLPVMTDDHGRFPPPGSAPPPPLPPLPPHLGWHSQAVTAALRQIAPPAQPPAQPPAPPPGGATARPPHAGPAAPPAPRQHVTIFPDVAVGLLRSGRAAAGRIWLLLRHLDQAGQGWLPLARVRRALAERPSALRVCGWRQLRNLLRDGDGFFWQRQNDRLWLRSVAKVAAALHVWRLNGRPVACPVSILTQRIGQVRAHLYASFLSGRTGRSADQPIARATLRDLTAVHPRTQRRYDRQARVRARANYALGPRLRTPAAEQAAWRQGSAAFALTDVNGWQGQARHTYLVWQLPNQYAGPHQPQPRGRQKRLNRALTDLLKQGTTGNGEPPVAARLARRFFGHGKAAAKAYNRSASQAAYWPAPQQGGAQIWYSLLQP